MDFFVCKRCGFSLKAESRAAEWAVELPVCPACKDTLAAELILDDAERVQDVAEGKVEDVPAGMTRLSASFTGTAGEYFRIWIVNTFLTILTLGIYGAWAKVRTRKYFYRNTVLDGHHFDYVANPKAILRGYLIVGAGFILYNVAPMISPLLSLAVLAAFAAVFPLLMYKSIRFFAHNSTYRNIRLRFLGSLGESYRIYLWMAILVPLTLGLIIPYWAYRKKQYFFGNMAFGDTMNTFRGLSSRFYRPYLMMFVLMVVLGAASVLMMPMLGRMVYAGAGASTGAFVVMMLLFYLTFIMVSVYISQYLYAWTTNYCFGHCVLGGVRLQSTLNGNKLFWIRLTNILAIVFSVGLLIPWAKVRRMKYIVEHMAVVTRQDLGEFTAASEVEESAYGDAATEFLDFEIGL